jgi:hypothetical protein
VCLAWFCARNRATLYNSNADRTTKLLSFTISQKD